MCCAPHPPPPKQIPRSTKPANPNKLRTGPLFPEPRKPSGFEEGPGSKRPAIRVQFRLCIFEWFTRNLWQRQACMVVAGTQQECRIESRKMPLRVSSQTQASHRKSCTPGASRIPQLVESSPECKAPSPWNVRGLTVCTWRNTGPPDAPREAPWVLVCGNSLLNWTRFLQRFNGGVGGGGTGPGRCAASPAFFRVRPRPLLIAPN